MSSFFARRIFNKERRFRTNLLFSIRLTFLQASHALGGVGLFVSHLLLWIIVSCILRRFHSLCRVGYGRLFRITLQVNAHHRVLPAAFRRTKVELHIQYSRGAGRRLLRRTAADGGRFELLVDSLARVTFFHLSVVRPGLQGFRLGGCTRQSRSCISASPEREVYILK